MATYISRRFPTWDEFDSMTERALFTSRLIPEGKLASALRWALTQGNVRDDLLDVVLESLISQTGVWEDVADEKF